MVRLYLGSIADREVFLIFQVALARQATHCLTGDIKDFGSFINQPESMFGMLYQTVAEFLSQLG